MVENSNRTGIESRMMCGAASSFLYTTEKVMMETKRNANHDVVRTKWEIRVVIMKHSSALHGMSLGDSCRQEVNKRMWNAIKEK